MRQALALIVALHGMTAGVLALAGSGQASRHSAPTKSDFLATYIPAATKIENLYRHAEIEGVLHEENWKWRPPKNRSARIVILTNGEAARLERTSPGEEGKSLQNVRVAHPAISFDVSSSNGGAYALNRLSRDYSYALEGIRLSKMVFAPTSIFENSISEFIAFQDLTIVTVSYSDDEGESVATLRYERTFVSDGKELAYDGYFEFLPAHSWALRAYGRGPPGDEGLLAQFEYNYNDEVDGVPLLSQATYWRVDEEGERVNIERFEVTRFEPKLVDDKEFTLAAFGLKDVRQPAPSRIGYVVIAVGIAMLFIALFARWAIARRAA